MSTDEARIVDAARAWALALAALEKTKQQIETDAELAIYSAAAREDALKCAELALFQAVQQR